MAVGPASRRPVQGAPGAALIVDRVYRFVDGALGDPAERPSRATRSLRGLASHQASIAGDQLRARRRVRRAYRRRVVVVPEQVRTGDVVVAPERPGEFADEHPAATPGASATPTIPLVRVLERRLLPSFLPQDSASPNVSDRPNVSYR